MKRLVILMIVMLLAAAACSFEMGGSSDKTDPTLAVLSAPTVTPFQTLTPRADVTVTPFQTSTPVPTATPINFGNTGNSGSSGSSGNSGSSGSSSGNTIPCAIRTDWPIYTVQAGDTLSRIAQRVGTTTNVLVSANCLSNANLISVGQGIRVPQLPPPPTVAPIPPTITPIIPTPGAPVFKYAPIPTDEYLHRINDLVATADPFIMLVTEVLGAQYVRFMVQNTQTGQVTHIGEQSNPNGTGGGWLSYHIGYTFPAPGQYIFYAVARTGSVETTSANTIAIYNPDMAPIFSDQRIDTPPVIEPNVSYENGMYELEPGATVNFSWPDAPTDAERIVYTLTPTGTGTAIAMAVIATDTTPADGVPVEWQVTGTGLWGHFQASAYMPDGRIINSQIVNIFSEP